MASPNAAVLGTLLGSVLSRYSSVTPGGLTPSMEEVVLQHSDEVGGEAKGKAVSGCYIFGW